jgi:YD repeat-containing protein
MLLTPGRLRRLLLVVLVLCVVVVAAVFAGPVASGAIFLLLPGATPPRQHDLPDSYEPLHKGGIDLPTGLYTRVDEDIVLSGTPPLMLRRTYLSRYPISREFGVGTTHDGEWYLSGDPERLQSIALILANGSRVDFERVSAGTSYVNGLFEHRTTPSEYLGARLGWVGFGWALRRRDGSGALFQPCGPNLPRSCSVILTRGADGHVVRFARDASGRLLRIEAAADRWIALDYDGLNRITRASDSAGRDVRYAYDAKGRLSHVKTSDGTERRYTYTDRDEMRTIAQPDMLIENSYDGDGLCVRQVTRFPGEAEPYVLDFEYRRNGRAIVRTRVTSSDGSWTQYTFNASRYSTSETWGRNGLEPANITYERDATTNVVTALEVTCPDFTGRPLRHRTHPRPGRLEWVKWDLLRTHCSWSQWSRGRPSQQQGLEPHPPSP